MTEKCPSVCIPHEINLFARAIHQEYLALAQLNENGTIKHKLLKEGIHHDGN